MNPFAVRKQVDGKRLKKHLWETMEPKLSNPKEALDVEMKDEGSNYQDMALGAE